MIWYSFVFIRFYRLLLFDSSGTRTVGACWTSVTQELEAEEEVDGGQGEGERRRQLAQLPSRRIIVFSLIAHLRGFCFMPRVVSSFGCPSFHRDPPPFFFPNFRALDYRTCADRQISLKAVTIFEK